MLSKLGASTRARTFSARYLWRSRNRYLELNSPYAGTDAGTRYACTMAMDRVDLCGLLALAGLAYGASHMGNVSSYACI